MNQIGFGIFCFGENYYYKGTEEKIKNILEKTNSVVYVLTDTPEYFKKKYTDTYVKLIPYTREFKSYHDKLILVKHILLNHDICILIDADLYIKDYSFLNKLKKYNFKTGISYVDTLENHPSKNKIVSDINMSTQEWSNFKIYADNIYPHHGKLSTIWEYFLVFNKIGFKQTSFFKNYEKLQLAKEFSDLYMCKDVNAAGEGVSLNISAYLSNCDIQRDFELYEIIKDSMISISRRFTRPECLPDFMKDDNQ